MPTYHDGQIIHLPKGWTIECDASTRENGECQGFVFSPKKQGKVRESASLNSLDIQNKPLSSHS